MITGLAITKRRRPRPGQGGGSSQGKNYILVQTSIVSEWVENSNGETVKVIKSGAVTAPGSYETTWDKKLEDGSDAGNGVFTVKRQVNNVVDTWQGAAYNSSLRAGVARENINRGLDFIQDMVNVGSNLYYTNGYPEGDTDMFKVSVSNPHSRTKIIPTNASGPPRFTKMCASPDGSLIYWAGDDPYFPKEIKNLADPNFLGDFATLTALQAAHPTSTANKYARVTSGGEDKKRYNWNTTTNQWEYWLYTFIIATNTSDDTIYNASSSVTPTITYAENNKYRTGAESKAVNNTITGLACNETYLFVAKGGQNKIVVINRATYAFVRDIGIMNPQNMHVDASGNLWVVESTDSIKKYTINGDGTLTGVFVLAITSPLAVASQGGLLYATNGDTGQVQTYNLTNGNPGTSIGVLNGYRDSEVVSDFKFDWKSVRGHKNTFLTPQGDGKLWICDPGNYRVQRLSVDRLSVDEQITYVPRAYKIDLDRGNNKRLFFGLLEAEVDYIGDFDESFTLKKNWGYHVSQADYDEFTALISPTTLQNNRTYCLLPKNGNKQDLKLCELVNNKGLIVHQDTGINNGPELYPDGTLRYVAGRTFGKYTITGYSNTGKPTLSAPVIYATAPVLDSLDPNANPTTNFGHTGEILDNGLTLVFNNNKGAGYHGGALIPGTNKYRYKFAKANATAYNGAYPTDGTYNRGNSVTNNPGGIASTVIAVGSLFFWHAYMEFYNGAGGQIHMFHLYTQEGALVKVFGRTKSPEGAVLPGMAGNGFSIAATRENGKIYIYNNDESYFGGIHRWELSGLDTIKTDSFTVKGKEGGLTYSSEELPFWRENLDLPANSNEKARINTNANTFITNVNNAGNNLTPNVNIDFWSGDGIVKKYTKVPIVSYGPPAGWVGGQDAWNPEREQIEAQHYGMKIKDCAFLYLLTNEAKYLNPVKKVLLAQAALANTDFSNRSRWDPTLIRDQDPFFFIAEFVMRMLTAYSFVKHALTSDEQQKLDTWFANAGKFFQEGVNSSMFSRYVSRTTYLPTSGNFYAASDKRPFDGHPFMPVAALQYNNRVATNMRTVGAIGALLYGTDTGTSLINTAKLFFKEWIRFSVSTAGWIGEMERAGNTGLHYASYNIGLYIQLAEILARKGDRELLLYKTTEFYPGNANTSFPFMYGSEKSIIKVMKWYGDVMRGAINVTYNGEPIDGTDPASGEGYNELNFAMITNLIRLFISESESNIIKSYYKRTISGSNPIPAYNSQRRNGSHRPNGGIWESYPSIPVMFFDMEGKVNPYGS